MLDFPSRIKLGQVQRAPTVGTTRAEKCLDSIGFMRSVRPKARYLACEIGIRFVRAGGWRQHVWIEPRLPLALQRDREVPTVTIRIEVADIEAIERYFVRPDAAGNFSQAGYGKMSNGSRINSGDCQPAASAAFERNGGCAGPGQRGAARPRVRLAEQQGRAEVPGRGGGQCSEIAADVVAGPAY